MTTDVDKQAQIHEAEVVPCWTEPFARLLVATAPVEPRATVLDVLCGTGSASLALLSRLDARGRVVGIDPSNALLNLGRRKAAEHLGKRLFFRHEKVDKLSFADDVFDLVVSNAGVLEQPEPNSTLAECLRVTKPGGVLAMTLCLRGTFQELLDLLREVLERLERADALARLDEAIRSFPSDNEAIARFEGLGLRDVALTRSTFPIQFSSGTACLGSALVAQRFLPAWTAVVGAADAPQIFGELAATIDTYFGPEPFEVTVQAACLVGRKEEYEILDDVEPHSASAPRPEVPEDSADRITPVREMPIPPEASGVGAAPLAPADPKAAPAEAPAPPGPPEEPQPSPPDRSEEAERSRE